MKLINYLVKIWPPFMPTLLVVAGLISAQGATVTWIGGSGDWNSPSNWSTGALPGTTDDIVISPTNTSITVTHSSGAHTVRSIQSQQAFVLSGGLLTVSGTIQVNNSFTFDGGTLANANLLEGTNGASLVVAGHDALWPNGPFLGMFNGVTIGAGSVLDASAFEAYVEVFNGLTVNGTVLLGNNGRMLFQGTQALKGTGTVVFGTTGAQSIMGISGGTLTIGSGITIQGAGGQLDALNSGDLIVNNGTITANGSGTMTVAGPGTFTSSGTLMVTNGGYLAITPNNSSSWTNMGTIIASGGTLTFGASWTNSGTILATNSTVNLGGTFTHADLGTLQRMGGSLNLGGQLDNTGGILDLDALGWCQLIGGTIYGGTVRSTNGVPIYGSSSGGTLDGVTLDAPLMVASGAAVTIVDGLNLDNFIQIGDTNYYGSNGRLFFIGNQALLGSGHVFFNSLAPGSSIAASSGSSLTVGPGIAITGSFGEIDAVGGAIVNQGTIDSDVTGCIISIDYAGAGNFTNAGTIAVSNGGTMTVGQYGTWNNTGLLIGNGGTFNLGSQFNTPTIWFNQGIINVTNTTMNLYGLFTTAGLGNFYRNGGTINLVGYLDNSDGVLDLDALGPWYLDGGTIHGGTIQSTNDVPLYGTAPPAFAQANGTLDGVTVNAPLVVANGAAVTVINGLVLNNVMTLGGSDYSYDSGRVIFSGTQTLSGNGQVILNIGFFQNGTWIAPSQGSTLTIGPGITIHGLGGAVGEAGAGAIVNEGQIISDYANGQIYIKGNFTNTGVISASFGSITTSGDFNSAAGSIQLGDGTLNLGGAVSTLGLNLSAFTRTGGSINLVGTLDNAGATLDLDILGNFSLSGGVIRNGTITGTNTLALEGNGHSGTFDGVALDVPVLVAGSATLVIMDGMVINSILSIGDSRVFCVGNETISGTGQINFEGIYGGGLYVNNGQLVFAQNSGSGYTLTIGPDLTVHGTGGDLDSEGGTIINEGDIISDVTNGLIYVGQNGGSLTNFGLLSAVQRGASLQLPLPGMSFGDIQAVAGSTISLSNSLQFDDGVSLDIQPGATLRVGGNLLGATLDNTLFSPEGAVVFNGNGTQTSPQMIEVMGQDWGPVSTGFEDNFEYGTLALSGSTYVRLVDLATNSPGTNSEALYVNSLVVPPNCTLDLNGLHLYARVFEIAGTIIGGSISQVAGGGAVALSSPASGGISLVGQSDGWSFFGRAGQMITVVVDPGSTNILSPGIGYAEVNVLDPATNVLSSASNAVVNGLIILTNINLPTDGVYEVRIQAPSNKPASTGNYQLTIWDSTTNVYSLTLNEIQNGQIANPYKVDQWFFSGVSGQQVNFNLLNVSVPGVAFDLRGPNGWIGFSNLTGSSGLVDLPSPGNYALTAHSAASQYGMNYAFKMLQTAVTNLALGSTYTGNFVGDGQAQLFEIANPENQPLQITLQNEGLGNNAQLYVGFGFPPTPGKFTQAAPNGTGANQQILVNNAYAGTWYVLVYGNSISTPGAFTLGAQSQPIFVSSVSPAQGGNNGTTSVQIQGAGFSSSAQVSLQGSGTSIPASAVTWVSSGSLVADFNLSGSPTGLYQLTIAQGTNTLSTSFMVTTAVGPKFQAQLTSPSGIGLDTVNTMYVEYSNTGDTPMPAPLLVVGAIQNSPVQPDPCANNWTTPEFALDPSQLSRDFWASSAPSAASPKVSFFASGKIPGILLPGESGRVPVYFLGWAANRECFVSGGYSNSRIVGWRIVQEPPPSDPSAGGFSFQLYEFLPPSIATSGSGQNQPDQPMNWQSLLTNAPPNIQTDAWQVIWMNYTNEAGNTLYSYFGMLQQEVNYLFHIGTLGNGGAGINSVNDLANFAVIRADGLPLIRTIASASDGYVPTPSLRLSFDRTFPNTISGRYRLGRVGRGWSDNWDYHLTQATNGNVTISIPGGGIRTFMPDLRGGYTADPGDYGQLVSQGGGTFSLNEKGGLIYSFNADGTLGSVEDPNGNSIVCGYTGGLLASLSHSSGQSLSIGYNGQGRIQTVSDPVGRTTSFSYDAIGEHLTNVLYFDGRNVGYGYSIGNGAASEHALTTIQNADLTHQYFGYDSLGRLHATSRDGGAESVVYAYDNAGTIYVTDALTNTSELFFDNRGLLVRMQDPQGNVTQLSRDVKFNLTSVTDPAGRSYQYSHDNQGNVTAITDPLGNQTKFTYNGPFQLLSQLTDANGNPTSYGYDSGGNLLNIAYADNSVESWGYQSCCEPTSWTNRRTQGIQYQFNPTTGFLMAKLFPDGSQAVYTYDTRGNLSIASNYTGKIMMDYNLTNDRLQRITYPGGQWLQYTYDSAGRRQTMFDQLGYQLSYYYDNIGRLQSITNSQNSRIVFYQYDRTGRMQQKTLANGVFAIYGYDTAGHLQTLTNSLANGSVLSFFYYTYDERGRRRHEQTASGLWTYDYDDLGQLTHAVLASTDTNVPSQDLTYVYDALGNRTSTVENGVTTPYTPNNLNQYVSVGGTNYIFDADGNLVQESSAVATNVFAFNTENQLVSVVQGTNSWTYAYDAIGNRSVKIVNGSAVYCVTDLAGAGNVVGEFDGAGNLISGFDYGIGLESRRDAGQNLANYTFDGNASVQDLISAEGTLLNEYFYGPFGVVLQKSESIINCFQFNGQLGVTFERQCCYFMRNRFYGSDIGRLISTDPLGQGGADQNYYRYAMNSPLQFADPLGLLTIQLTTGDGYNAINWIGGYDKQGGFFFGTGLNVGIPDVIAGHISRDRDGNVEGAEGGIKNLAAITISSATPPRVTLSGSLYVPNPFGKPGGTLTYDYFNGTVDSSTGVGADVSASLNGIIYWSDVTTIFGWLNDQASTWLNEQLNEVESLLTPQAKTVQVSEPIYANDPNQKIVMTGEGAQGLVQGGALLPYRIDFENETNATAPAQQVLVSDQLTNALDWTTFELTEIQFGDQYLFLPAGTLHFQTNMPVTINGVSFVVQIQAGINPGTGKVSASFQSIDPNTDLPPPANVGFLPPEDGFGSGRGHLAYLVRPKTGLPSGTQIRNVALVQFDNGESIETDQIAEHDPSQGVDPTKQALVTIDSTLPVTAISGLPPVQTNTSFTVCWTGTDAFSPIVSYDVYISTNGGPWALWLAGTTNTCADFVGQLANQYGFFIVAHNALGYSSPAPYGAGSTTVLAPHLAPQISPVSNQFIVVGQLLTFTNFVQDPDLPISFSLGAGAPAGATIDTNGVFTWVPSCAQASTTNVITIWATDSYSIPLSNSVSFVVGVSECLQVGLGSTVLQVGTTSTVPVNIISTLDLTNLSFTVAYPTNRFTNWVMTVSNSAVGASSVQPVDSSQTAFNLSAKDGQTFKGPGAIGSLAFQGLPGISMFAPLSPTNVVGSKTNGSIVGDSGGVAGRAVLIGKEPLVEAWLGSNSMRMLTLYGNPGSSYQTLFNTNLLGTNWLKGSRIPMTNLYEQFGVDQRSPLIFYRAWEFFADPPVLELGQTTRSNLLLLLYGKAGTNYVLESTTNLSADSAWFPASNIALTNSFQFLNESGLSNNMMLFRAKRP